MFESILTVTNIAAIVLLLIGIPLFFKKVGPNKFYGFRTELTKSDSKVWYPVNYELGKSLIWTMGLYLVGSIVAHKMIIEKTSSYQIFSAAALGFLVITALTKTALYYSKLK